jgi:hypothetical protein
MNTATSGTVDDLEYPVEADTHAADDTPQLSVGLASAFFGVAGSALLKSGASPTA